jgi:hypothetical protein
MAPPVAGDRRSAARTKRAGPSIGSAVKTAASGDLFLASRETYLIEIILVIDLGSFGQNAGWPPA